MKRKGKDWRDKVFTLKSQCPLPKLTKKEQAALEQMFVAAHLSRKNIMPVLLAKDSQ